MELHSDVAMTTKTNKLRLDDIDADIDTSF